MLYLNPLSLRDVLKHAGVDLGAALGNSASSLTPHWRIATPVGDVRGSLAASKFYRSITEHVDDEDKRASFTSAMMGIAAAAQHQNYQAILQGYVSVKVAHDFKYRETQHKVWELKPNNKDRIYFFTLQAEEIGAKVNATKKPVISMLLAHHKKDQRTPKDVAKYCENLMKSHLDPTVRIQLCKE